MDPAEPRPADQPTPADPAGSTITRKSLPGRILAVDYGTRRIGLATCDARRTLVSPLKTLPSTGSVEGDARQIVAVAETCGCPEIVIGLPLNMDGSTGDQALLSRRLGQAIARVPGLTIHLFDERLTTFEADEQLRALDWPAKRRAEMRDALAAAALLRSFLESPVR